MTKKIPVLFLFILSFTIGIIFFQSAAEQKIARRDPATLNGKIYQISNLSAEQMKDQLQKNIKVTPTINGRKAIHFSGFSSALCKSYPHIEFEFAAEGIAVAGESPVMHISAPCEPGKDPSEIGSIYLPVGQILSAAPGNSSYQFPGFNASVVFKNSADEWPKQWVLKRVEFKHVDGINKSADFNRSPASVNEQPIVLEF